MKIPNPDDLFRLAPESASAALATSPPVPARAKRPKRKKRRLSLALQGGGSFGAFTWGVLDRLLEEDDLAFDAVSGASAGAMNAIMLAAGLADGGRAGAREALEAFWKSASEAAPRQRGGGVAVAITTHVLSPYQFNPFNLNPLRTILSNMVDFETLRAAPPVRMLIAATRVADGKLRIFREKELTADVVLASSCLPLLHHAVTIEGETYWDGGYAANPPLLPLIAASRAADVLLVQIMPSAGEEMPTSALEIARRMDQITFNSPLQHELEALAAMKKLSASDPPATRLSKKLHGLTVHHVAAEKEVPSLAQASALNLDWDFLTGLRDAGRAAADRWLERDFARVDASVATRERAPDAGETLVGAAPL